MATNDSGSDIPASESVLGREHESRFIRAIIFVIFLAFLATFLIWLLHALYANKQRRRVEDVVRLEQVRQDGQ
jgi:hypothetical protein